jgi:hypothetical protein
MGTMSEAVGLTLGFSEWLIFLSPVPF